VNTKTDDQHCGECLHPCQNDQHCIEGKCVKAYAESCDGVDNDFDGNTDEDDNGQPLTRSCDNLCGKGTETCTQGKWQNCTAPAPKDETCNGKDDDCDGLIDEDVATRWYEDYDKDGYGDPDEAYSTLACSKPADGTSPNGGNWSDKNTDCNDGYECIDPDTGGVINCDPAQIHPGAAEACDKIDNNCNGDIDENCACSPVGGTRPCGTDEGECVKGEQQCTANGWSECAGPGYVAPKPESCNLKDDDCDGEIDEELADDIYENNDTCPQARRMADIMEGDDWLKLDGLSLYHGAAGAALDEDWYVVLAKEAIHLDCIVNPGKQQCNFLFNVSLRVPSDADHEKYVFCVYASGKCGDFDYTFCSDDPQTGTVYNPTNRTYVMVLSWNGICGLDDSWDFYIQVKGKADSNLNSCESYQLGVMLDYQGPISDSCE